LSDTTKIILERRIAELGRDHRRFEAR
jgi:hypothetical protein